MAKTAAQLHKIFDALDWPAAGQPIPLAETLTPAQRKAVTELASQDGLAFGRAMPKHAWSKRRWLGIDKPGALEEPVTIKKKTAPLWFVLANFGPETDKNATYKATTKLPASTRLLAWVEMLCQAYLFDWHDDQTREASNYLSFDIHEITKKDAPRLSAAADWLIELHGKKEIDSGIRRVMFKGLIHCKAPWKASWTRLAHWDNGQPEAGDYMLAIPEEHRDAAMMFVADYEDDGIRWPEMLEKVDSRPVVERLIEKLPKLLDGYSGYTRMILPKLKVIGSRHPEIAAIVAKHASKKKRK